MRRLLLDDLVTSLGRKGFEVLAREGAMVRLARREEGRHDHVAITRTPTGWRRRLARRPRTVDTIFVGIVWPIGEMAFSRPVPPLPVLPHQVHASTSFTSLVGSEVSDVATVAAAIDDWCRRLDDPGRALEVGAIDEAVRRLEFAVVTSRRDVGEAAAEQATVDARALPPATRRQALKRIELARARLPG